MLLIEVNNDIGNKNDFCFWYNQQSTPFSAEELKKILADNPTEQEIRLNINCNGGSTREGFIIYDILRTSGRRIYANIEGGCHSMAIVLLLSAPYQNRTANPNSTALIHDVYSWAAGSTEDIKTQANLMESERERILSIYEDRTQGGKNREQLKNFMLEGKERSATELVEWGFISKTNNYNTNKLINKNKVKMSRNTKANLLDRIGGFFGSFKNYAFTDESGSELFTTQEEDSTLEIGMPATPDGTFETTEGITVVIENEEIVAIVASDSQFAATMQTDASKEDQSETENKALKAKLEMANSLLKEAKSNLEGRKQTTSNYRVKGRTVARTTNKNIPITKEEIRSKLKEDKN